MTNALKLAALHWAYPSVRDTRFQIPWDSNQPQYGKYHYAFAKAEVADILAYTTDNCPASDRDGIRAWMKGGNADDLHVGIDCNGFVYRVLDRACRMTGARTLLETMGEPCEYVSIDELTLPSQLVTRARDIRAGDAIRFNHGWHSGVIIETVTDEAFRLKEIWYAHSSFTRGPHIGHVEIGDPNAPLNDAAQNWVDDMWDALANNGIRDRYFQSVHHTPFYEGPRVQVARVEINITLEGDEVDFDIAPFVLGGRTLCQVRPLAEATGATVGWNQRSQRVTFTLGGRTAVCQIGSELATVNGEQRLLDEPPMMIDDHTVVPLRFVAEGLGYTVTWDQASRTADLRRN